MNTLFIPMLLLLALSVPALAQNNQGQNNNNQGQGYRSAPGPLAGAGLPVLLIGGGIYWIVRRNKSKLDFRNAENSTTRALALTGRIALPTWAKGFGWECRTHRFLNQLPSAK
jgi:hypothetical protein